MMLKQVSGVVVLIGTLSLSFAARAEPGYTFSVATTVLSNGKPQNVVVQSVVMTDDKARIEFAPQSRKNAKDWHDGDCFITTDGGKTFLEVNAGKKWYKHVAPDAMLADFLKQSKGAKVSYPTFVWSESGANQKRLALQYGMSIRYGVLNGKVSFEQTHDYGYLPPPIPTPAFNPVVSLLLTALHTPLLANDRFLSEGGYAPLLPHGFVAKCAVTVSAHGRSGFLTRNETVTTRMETSSFVRVADVDAAQFIIPANFAEKPR